MDPTPTEHSALFDLIESWEPERIELALTLLKKHPHWRKATQQRYSGLLQWVDRRQLRALPKLPQRLLQLTHYLKEHQPNAVEQAVLGTLPLDHLVLHGEYFQQLSDWLTHLTQVTQLSIISTYIRQLPPALHRWHRLRKLLLMSNRLRTLPSELGALTELRWLSIHQRHLPELPASVGQLQELRVLQLVNLSRRPWAVPDAFGACRRLERLLLVHPDLGRLPDWLEGLPYLQSLKCRASGLTHLPSWLGHLTTLEALDLSGNPIRELPPNLVQLRDLERLNLSQTPLFVGQSSGLLVGRMEIEAFFKKYFGQ